MSTPAMLRQLCALFAELYPDKASAVRVAEDAGIPIGMVALSDVALDNWHEILKEAQKRDRLAALLAVVEEEYGENQKLRAITRSLNGQPLATFQRRAVPALLLGGICVIIVWMVSQTRAQPQQPAAAPAVTPLVTPTVTAQPTAASFTYGVTVKDDATNQPIANAKVRIEVEGKAPLDEYADSNGFARIFIHAVLAERPGRLTVEADGYAIGVRNIDIWPDRLPAEVRLTRE